MQRLSIFQFIHLPGGNVLDGLAMYNALSAHPAKIYGHVEGIAASAASFILMASDSISMPEDSFLMIHNAHGGVFGDAEDMREMADIVDKLQNSIVNIYEKKTGLSRDDITSMMADETWMNASDAMSYGFIDTVTDAVDVAAKINIFDKYFKTMPVNTSEGIENIENLKDCEKYLCDVGGFSRRLAKALTSQIKKNLQRDVVDDNGQDFARAEMAMMSLLTSIN